VKFNPPTDALIDQPHLVGFRPCLSVQFSTPSDVNGRVHLAWTVRNVGQGVARKIVLFIPGIMTDALSRPIEVGTGVQRRTLYEDKRAFTGFMKPPVHFIAEFEDHAGNLYRQYAHVLQTTIPNSRFFAYDVEELDRPYLVADRIVRAPEYSSEDEMAKLAVDSDPLVGRIPFAKLDEAQRQADAAGQDTFAAKTFRELPEMKNLRQQAFDLIITVRKCLIRYHGSLSVDSFVSPEITAAFTKWLLAVKNKIERLQRHRGILRPQSKFPVTVTRLVMFLDDVEMAAQKLDNDIPPAVPE